LIAAPWKPTTSRIRFGLSLGRITIEAEIDEGYHRIAGLLAVA
jgi:hypothetical protein